MDIGKIIDKKREEKGYLKKDLAGIADINYKSFCDKLNRNSIQWDELFRLTYILNINLEELKERYVKEHMAKNTETISWDLEDNKYRTIKTGRF
ncbi:hypothetical protein U732_1309 [Clostridium argentinense CDC 2741]|uniref:HTH cro/C1-type domain-containing protein n=1 Tax=Clostridium argentinense CDC 2741 TaxID=1418104 RepID=A0A0C1R8M7_9CLOT|nr:hypothetical protein [Clostridium argentinense]ARC85476.1 hypothetical protein RSJ17_13680 [Clostridium argentinense]KIE46881.1 hypothetical protein U732_1309 [Clostridium argentinense CDC 2741]NFF39989.1 hypothetical protein [Clostridium argentinense]NFP50313.1 hypothetical protein [Clostridium argentinense]NFP71954.1 hypothetical protein [Clostridium argentinense]